MKSLLFCCFLTSALAQIYIPHEGGLIDYVHGFAVHYDDENNYIIFANDDECYMMRTPPQEEERWDTVISDPHLLHQYTDEVYKQIEDHEGLRQVHAFSDEGVFGDIKLDLCLHVTHKYFVTYTGNVGE